MTAAGANHSLVQSPPARGAIGAEAARAQLRHGGHPMAGPGCSSSERLVILAGEAGEDRQLTCHQGGPGAGRKDPLVSEPVQVAAMAAAWVQAFEGWRP